MLNAMFKQTVIDGLECCTNRPKNCNECPYQGYNPPDDGNYPDCQELLMIHALSKLKYPEGICQPKKELDDEIAKRCIICPKCGHKLGTRKGAYCDEDKNGH